jgi:undecaprenyl-diphosphatase
VSWIAAALLGVVQGLTEFLPVSSSAHLVLARAFFGWNVDEGAFGLAFDVALHAGTLLAIVVYFAEDLAAMAAAVPEVMSADRGAGKLARLIVIGTIPVVIVGLTLAGWMEDHLRTPPVIVITLVVGALWMIAAERYGTRHRNEDSLTAGGAMLVGAAQASALVPGMSRSGSTIAMAMLLGLTRESAARFSFLLGVPAMFAAAAHEGRHLLGHPMDALTAQVFVTGIIVSGIVGYATVKYFLRYLASHSLAVFGWYRIALAAVTVAWLLA